MSLGGKQNSVDRLAERIEEMQRDVKKMERQVDRFAITCQALWELLREETTFDESAVLERIREIDLRDGVDDGRITAVPVDCPACKRRSNAKRRECVYCGEPLGGGLLFAQP